MKHKITPVIEYVTESTTACLVTMVQGNLLALTASHLLIASQTGIIAGAFAAVALFVSRNQNRWLFSAILGLATATVDYFVHPSMFGAVATEAIVTGIAAGVLSYIVGETRFDRLLLLAQRKSRDNRREQRERVVDHPLTCSFSLRHFRISSICTY